jgi:hypothetical protein
VLLVVIDLSETLGMRSASQFNKGRPVVDTPQGTFIATIGRGIVFVSSDASQARRFDWRHDIPTSTVARMRVRGNLLYLMDNNTGLAVVDWTKLLRMPEPSPREDSWKIYAASAQPVAAPDGAIWWLDRPRLPGRLNRWRDGKLTSVSLESSRFDTLNIRSVAADSKGGIWLLYDSAAVPTPCFRNEEWNVFSNGDLAWSSLALEEKDNPTFRFVGSGIACPVFGGNGRVAYRDLMKGARYFDGAEWQTIPQPNGRGFTGLLSFENGILTMGDLNGYFQLTGGKWQPRSEPIARNSGAHPFSAEAIAAPPEDFPGDRSRCRTFLSDAANTLWAGNLDELYRGTEHEWVRFPTIGTPLFAATYITQVLVDDSGDLWFVLNNAPSQQLVHYYGGGKVPSMEWIKAPTAMTQTARIELSCRVAGSMDEKGTLRYRMDEGSWRKIPLASFRQPIVMDNLPNGMHKVEIRAYDALLRSSRPLVASFEVKRDYDAEIKDLIPQFGDSNKREAAARALASIGRPAVPALTAQKEKANSQLRWWIQAVLDEITRSEKSEGK